MHSKFDKALGMALLLPVLSFAGAVWAAPSHAAEAVFMTSAQAQAFKPARPVAGAPVPDTSHGEVLFNHRVGNGKEGGAEMHTVLDVFYVIQDGHADVVAGGHLENPNGGPPAGDEDKHGKLVGGKTYSMGPGDILWMPAGTPHEVNVAAGATFTWIAVRGAGLSVPKIP